MTTSRISASQRSEYRAFKSIPTRWADNDLYGHVNNVVYYMWFDTAINSLLMEEGVLDIHSGDTVGFVVETHCNYISPISFPQTVDIGIRVGRIGTSSVRYEVAVFPEDAPLACAQGHFMHVYVDRASQRPVPIAGDLERLLQRLVWP